MVDDDGLICNNRILVVCVIKLKRFTKVKGSHVTGIPAEWHFSEKDLPEGEGDSVELQFHCYSVMVETVSHPLPFLELSPHDCHSWLGKARLRDEYG